MSNISFSELRAAISKACSTNSTESIDGIYGFSVDMAKLDEILREKKSNLYSLGFKSVVESKVPGFEDIQNITEYMRDEKTISNTFNGKVQVCEFMLFLKECISFTRTYSESPLSCGLSAICSKPNISKECIKYCNSSVGKMVT